MEHPFQQMIGRSWAQSQRRRDERDARDGLRCPRLESTQVCARPPATRPTGRRGEGKGGGGGLRSSNEIREEHAATQPRSGRTFSRTCAASHQQSVPPVDDPRRRSRSPSRLETANASTASLSKSERRLAPIAAVARVGGCSP